MEIELPAGYRVLFLAGGAMQQFALVPMNLLGGAQRAAYADSGYWAQRAIAEARRYCEVVAAPGFEGAAPLAAPPGGRWDLPADCAYCHITPNETVDGLAYPALPDTGEVVLVADATSCLLTAPLDLARIKDYLEGIDLIQRAVTKWATVRRTPNQLALIGEQAAPHEPMLTESRPGAVMR
mgnify:CR=1 FL=1